MIEGPLSGKSDSDAASADDLTALTATVAGNTSALAAKAPTTVVDALATTVATKASSSGLTAAEATIATHTGQLAGLTNSFNNIGTSFYTKTLTDALLSGKEPILSDGDLTIARTSGLQSALDAKQATIQCVAANTLTTFTTPVVCNFDLQCADLTANSIYGPAAAQITSAIAGRDSYGATLNAASYSSSTGSWNSNSTTDQWSPSLHINGVGSNHSLTTGVNTTASETVTYTIPRAFRGGSIYLNHIQWSDCGYADCFIVHSTNAWEIFTTRINTHNSVSNIHNGGNYDGVRVDCIVSGGYPVGFGQIRIKVRKGCLRIMGLGFTKEVDRPVAALSGVHSDNVFGDPSSLSDTRLKANQQAVSAGTMTSIFDAVEAKEYDFRPPGADVDGQPLPSERRVGFIADDVQAALPAEWSNIVSSKHAAGDEYLTLDYSRLVCILWTTVKSLTARVAALEA